MKQGSKKKLQLIQGLIEKRQTELLLYFLFFISNSLNLLFQISNKNGLYLLLMLLTLALLTFQLVKSNYLYSSKERFRLFLLFSFYQLLSLFVGFSLNIPDIDREYFFTELYPVFQLNYLSPIIFIFTVMFLILNWK
ncbi:TPA: hypothetical protein U1D22_002055, partial [Streptococcus suis]|nr:hypothetical protein [Streptococcus suis]